MLFSWQGYVPTALERRRPVMDRKRQEYCNLVEHYYDTRLQELHQETFRQVTCLFTYSAVVWFFGRFVQNILCN